jgi:hypothetical protein
MKVGGEDSDDYSRPLPGPVFPHSGRLTNSWLLNGCKFEGLLGTFESSVLGTSLSEVDNSPSSNFTAFFDNEINMPSVAGGAFSVVNGTSPTIISVDSSYASLAQEILQNGGDAAHVLQSLITVAASSQYYDQLPQFTGRSKVQQTSFVLVLVPLRSRGYIASMALICTHLLIGIVVVLWFLKRTKISSVGNSWQCVAQIASNDDIQRLFREGTLATDGEIEEKMSAGAVSAVSDSPLSLRPNELVGIKLDENGEKTRLFLLRPISGVGGPQGKDRECYPQSSEGRT